MPTRDVDPLLRLLILGAGLAALLLAVASTRADVDLWGHLRFGLDILEQGRLVRVDPYSFTADRPWLNHEWLSEVAFALAWKAGGNSGLILLKLACMLGALAIVAAVLRRSAVSPRAQAIVVAVSLLGIYPRSAHVRPQLFSVLLFALLLAICDRAERGRPAVLALSVPVLLAWANLHGGWIVGLATVTAWAAGLWWMRAAPWTIVALPLAAAAATLANPHGAGLWTFLLDTVRFGRAGIPEWGPIWNNAGRFLIWLCLAATLLAAAVRARPANPARLAIPALWGAAAFRVNRLDAFFALSVAMLVAPHVAALLPIRPHGGPSMPSRKVQAGVAAAILCVVLALPWTRRPLTCIEVSAAGWPEPAAVAFIERNQLAGRMVTHFNWGEYAIWHLPPAVSISFDGRRETVYSDRIIEGHLELYAGTNRGLAFLQALNPDYVWLPRQLAVVDVLRARGWTIAFAGPRSVILQRGHASAGIANGEPGPLPPARCFPGP